MSLKCVGILQLYGWFRWAWASPQGVKYEPCLPDNCTSRTLLHNYNWKVSCIISEYKSVSDLHPCCGHWGLFRVRVELLSLQWLRQLWLHCTRWEWFHLLMQLTVKSLKNQCFQWLQQLGLVPGKRLWECFIFSCHLVATCPAGHELTWGMCYMSARLLQLSWIIQYIWHAC